MLLPCLVDFCVLSRRFGENVSLRLLVCVHIWLQAGYVLLGNVRQSHRNALINNCPHRLTSAKQTRTGTYDTVSPATEASVYNIIRMPRVLYMLW